MRRSYNPNKPVSDEAILQILMARGLPEDEALQTIEGAKIDSIPVLEREHRSTSEITLTADDVVFMLRNICDNFRDGDLKHEASSGRRKFGERTRR